MVGAPWRCGVLTTLGGIAGIGLGRLLGREHASSPDLIIVVVSDAAIEEQSLFQQSPG